MVAVVAVVACAQISASAQLKLPELPLPTSSPLLDEPLDLEDLLNLDELVNELPVTTDVGGVVDGVTDGVSNLIGGGSDPDVPGGTKKPAPGQPGNAETRTGSWSTDRLLPPSGYVGPVTRVGSTRLPAPSYAAAVGEGFARAARRAAQLAGPVAAPMILALFAVGLLFVAARGPGRLVKVEEERSFSDRRTFRL